MKYARAGAVFLVVIAPLAVVFLSMFPAEGMTILFFPLSAVIGALIGVGLSPLFLWFYKRFIGKDHLYTVQKPEEIEQGYGISKGFFPMLMATNLAIILIFDPFVMELPWMQPYSTVPGGFLFPFFLFASLLQLPAFALFTAAWTIDGAGIVSMNKHGSTELQAAGKWFLAFLKGYAGIGVLIALYQLTAYILSLGGHFSTYLFPAILPLLGTVLVIPGVMAIAATEVRRRNLILGYAEKFGIKSEFEIAVRRLE